MFPRPPGVGTAVPPHPLRVPHSAHLGVEEVSFAEVALATFFVAKEVGKVTHAQKKRWVSVTPHVLGLPA